MNLILKSILRKSVDHFKVTIYKDSILRLKCKIGDILILKVNEYMSIKPIHNDYCISLPFKLLREYRAGEKINLEILGIFSREVSQKRVNEYLIDNLLDLRYFVPLKTQFNMPIYILKISDESSMVWYPRGGYARPIKIKNLIDPIKLSEFLGFFFGDGSKSKGLRSFRLTNCEPFILKYCMGFLDEIILEKPEYRCQIIYSTDKKLDDSIKLGCIDFWSKKLDLTADSFVSVNKTKNKKETLEYGSVRIQVNSTVLTELVLYGILPKFLQIIQNPKNKLEYEMLKGFLRGLFAAEGWSNSFEGKLKSVGLAFNPHSKEPELYQKLLKKLDIDSKRRKKRNSILIYKYQNFHKLFQMKLFSLYPSKNIKFENSFMNLLKVMKQSRLR